MKKNILMIAVAVFAAIFSFSCSKSEIEPAEITHSRVFYASTPSSEKQTRLYMDADSCIYWTAGDEISVFSSSANERYRFAGKTGEISNEFVKVENGVEPQNPLYARNYAIYPYMHSSSASGDGAFHITLPKVQKYAKDSFGQFANTMAAATGNISDDVFLFKNVGGFIQVKLYGGGKIRSIRFSGNDGEKIAGPATVVFGSGDIPEISMDSDASTEIELDCGEDGVGAGSSKEFATSFWIAVPPTTFSKGFKVEVKDCLGMTRTIKTTKSIEITRNAVQPMSPAKGTDIPEYIGMIDRLSPNISSYLEYYNAVKNFDAFLNDKRLNDAKYSNLKKVLDDCNIPVSSVSTYVEDAALFRHARSLMDSIITVDTHCDFPCASNSGASCSITKSQSGRQLSIEKMSQGHICAQYMAFYKVPIGSQTDYENVSKLPKYLWDYINKTDAHFSNHSDVCGIARNKADILRLKSEGKKAFLYGLENGLWAGTDLSIIAQLADKGVTYITLCHVGDNLICHSSNDSEDSSKGLTEFGRAFVTEMNNQGIVVDISHTSRATQREVIEFSKAPVVFSHSGAYDVCVNPRNVDDETMRLLAAKDGVIQILMVPKFMGGSGTGLKEFIKHLDHCVKTVGAEHVGIGADFDGGGGGVNLNGANDYINITMELIKLGYSDEDITKIWGENYLRVLAAAQALKETE